MALSRDFEERQKIRQRQRRIERERRKKLQKLWLILLGVLIVLIIILCATKCSGKKVNTVVPAENAATTEATASPAPTEAAAYSSIPAPTVGNNDFLDVIKASGQTHHVYLTFDEGPDPDVTPKMLDALRRYNVKATFFVTGREIERYPYLITRIIDEGHLVLPLSYSGNVDRLYADKNDFIDEVNKTYELICDNSPSGTNPIKIYRFPGGSGENTTYGTAKQTYKDELAKNGYYFCDWNTTIGDETGTRTPEQLIQYFNNYRPELNNLIIRLCNTSQHANTAQVLGTLIGNLLNEGYTFNRLDEVDGSGAAAAAASEQPTEEAGAADTTAATAAPVTNATGGTASTGTTSTNTTSAGTTSTDTTSTGASTGTPSAGSSSAGTGASTGTASTGNTSSSANTSTNTGDYLIPE